MDLQAAQGRQSKHRRKPKISYPTTATPLETFNASSKSQNIMTNREKQALHFG